MTVPVFFKKDDVLRVWGHGHEVCIAKDTGVYIITWNPDTPKAPKVDMASGYLEDGYYLNEEETHGTEKWSEIWDTSRWAVGGDDFCDPLPDPRETFFEGATKLAIHVKEEDIEMWWVK